MARVNNQYKVTSIKITDSKDKRVTLNPVYTGNPDFTVGLQLASNTERVIEILIPPNSASYNFFLEGNNYYMDFTAV